MRPSHDQCTGVVLGSAGGPGAATDITYTVALNMPSGQTVVAGVSPVSNRPPPGTICDPAPVGTGFICGIDGNDLHPYFQEWPQFVECANLGGGADSPGTRLLRTISGMSASERATLRSLLNA